MTRYANMKIDDTLEDLKATDAQKKAVHASTEKIIASGLALGNEHESTKAEVLAQWNATTADRTKLHNLVDARMDAFRSFAHSAVDELVKIHDTLTPAQRSEVSEHFKE